MAFELTEDFIKELQEHLSLAENNAVLELVNEIPEQDLSAILYELETEESVALLNILTTEKSAQVISELDTDIRLKILKHYSPEQIASFIQFIDSDDAVDLINELSVKTGEEVIAFIQNPEKADHIIDLLHYDEDCAGGLMAKELIKANLNWTIDRCIEEIRAQSKNVDKVFSVYVVDDNMRLLGLLSLKKLLLSDEHAIVADIYDPTIKSIESYRSGTEVADLMRKYDLETIPVVNVQGKLLGRITIDDVIDLITEQADLERQIMAGISNDTEEDDSVWLLSKSRLPWLIVGMIGGILGAQFIGLFENVIHQVTAMAFFIPLITATGGNVGIQSSSMIVQSLARDSTYIAMNPDRFIKGFVVSLINGIAISSLVFIFNLVLKQEMDLALTVSIALFCVVLVSSFMGTITPLILFRFGVNPALASGPFITTANDLLGLGIYFSVAHLLYSF
ncbi:magnesium transporter [Cytophaga hutchinsonii]|jgi:magnesium transporter|uniref:Magnesium transporter MgtE n=1 Tax=Cytophaga hutchinsonii (strain ATCC 33406 / DSM 1761 / CIP 103989 / NBRC 15051 / NCIMB 9469 / D465) TaxID=269798 RepID=A0A6N4SRC0_CYTH3|nr:magnesium transporter [Cytophaga hutchinsonii]ABG58898.1 magnesium transporter, MgtE [Cytophaga hutchinsonii ATCC 33406]SFX81626.1 magnesium transporter [Cytophaga hutchinsonii ATCC 33406]